MKTFVSALLVVGDDSQFLARTLEAISNQPIHELIVVDTSVAGQPVENRIVGNFEIKYAAAPKTSYAAALALAATAVSAEANWLWLLHDDSAPLDGALTNLLAVAEASPSAAVIGPKQVDWNNPRIIRQLGLTLTKRGNLFTRVTGALDQSQHDADSDVLAVGTAGALIRREVFDQFDGFDLRMPALAADFDFSMRARAAGFRVLVAPQARVAHVLRSMTGPKTALRKAEIQLQLSYLPLGFALAYWFGLPLTTLVRLIWRLANKRPDRLGGELAAGIWGYFTIFARLASRRSVSRSARKAMRVLYATSQQVRDDRLRDIEADEIEARVEAHAQLAGRDGDTETTTAQILLGQVSKAKSFVAGGGLWFVAALLVLSWSFWPSDEAVIGGGTIPLAQNWLDLFARAGASWHPIGHGFVAPADPFVWVLSAFGAITFWAPSLSISIFFFAAKALGFVAAYKAVSVFTRKSWVRNVSALAYVLWPTFALAQQQLRITSLIAMVFTPFVVYTVARVALLGAEISVRTKAQTWTWVALSGLSIAVVTAAAPNTIPVIVLGLALVFVMRPRRFGYLIWTGLPFAAIFAPYAFYLIAGIGSPLAVLADPGVPVSTASAGFFGFLVGNPGQGLGLTIGLAFGLGTVLLAAVGLLSRSYGRIAGLLGFGLLALALAWLVAHLDFVAIGIGSVTSDRINGNPYALLGIWALALVCAIAVLLDGLLVRSVLRVSVVALVAAVITPGIWFGVQHSASVGNHATARVMPALIDAQAQAGSQAQVLIISKSGSRYTGEWVPVSGVQLEDLSVAYRFALSNVEAQSKSYASVATLVADLVSGNTPDPAAFSSNQIQYVLVPNPNTADATAISASLDQVSNLQAAGLTEYGKVWRVQGDSQVAAEKDKSLWSITKLIQLGVLIGFLLLAIPTTARRKQASGAEIFIYDTDEGDQ